MNGFMGSRNGEVIPEWRFSNGKRSIPSEGAEMFEVKNGVEKLIGIFDGQSWIRVK
ncbi:hypothetical protein [Listeria seeligeri]|uniref:hypothetical protein n=1 Tax=Listeria seeligeri TaxID=1640 RepID=UPI0016235821|nr:hypothetical protein [Listeria seeligeri]MBC1735814.1 hypothetical protein [Listeria seeligeri]MBF2366997.1 hypothetical protein [Listeria seeligeri]MBF2386418.1 hypothetical protein [Listeria seeligeri]MBF2538453.1 hypothetical protein [Listeria seeligeri]MBF2585688.1 hypothetical protein [Listeria seeligeri]